MALFESYSKLQGEGSVWRGLGIASLLNGLAFVTLFFGAFFIGKELDALANVLLYAALAIGLTQLLYMVPLYIHYRSAGLKATAKGVLIIACVTALLNGTCWVTVGSKF